MLRIWVLSFAVWAASCGIIGSKKSDSGDGSSGPVTTPSTAFATNHNQNLQTQTLLTTKL